MKRKENAAISRGCFAHWPRAFGVSWGASGGSGGVGTRGEVFIEQPSLDELQKGWLIDSGKQFKARFSGAGMRWSRPGAERLLPIRAAIMMGRGLRHPSPGEY